MFHFRKLRLTFTFPIFNFSPKTHLKPSQNPRFLQTTKNSPILQSEKKFTPTTIREAQSALLEYLHSTRSLQFTDADNICKNSPFFIQDLLRKVKIRKESVSDMKKSISRYLCYHPINEFEPFFESMGLRPSEYVCLLPKDMIFLNDDVVLMENYHTLCNYGVPRNKMGMIFKEAPQLFRYENGVLSKKIQAYENLGVAPSTLVKVVTLSPSLLVGDVNVQFVKVVDKLKGLVAKGGSDWIERHLLDCNWGLMLELLCLLGKVCSEEQLGDVIHNHPRVVESGGTTLSLIGFLLKFGLSVKQICLVFLEFPQIRADQFLKNLRQCFVFLNEIEMQAAEIGKIFQSHSLMLGSSTLKKTNSLLCNLNVGKKRLCRFVEENPQEIRNWAVGMKVQPLENSNEDQISKEHKIEFLLGLGYVENSEEMKKAFKLFRGRGTELQERFDFIVEAGLDCEVVREMITVYPQILNQSTDRINFKIELLVKEGYPISSLVNFPSFLSYTPGRVKLRLSMYNWLKDHGAADPGLSLSTVIACSEKVFVKQYVNRHPSGPQAWQDLKAQIPFE
ncbi:hypothetical protein Lal_00017427 [Lupinus albus]|uniref:Putative transcription regulator mTERF family n=1 Tax=Lupinus albus TaxID=3870 RepID=A0A6A5MEG0_LUPAL|nr:putative transcription regulator mTERF family [Lupinus albus]KAF1869850.1 hypothetical protein Lal_00017427 [Lupinus albus]